MPTELNKAAEDKEKSGLADLFFPQKGQPQQHCSHNEVVALHVLSRS